MGARQLLAMLVTFVVTLVAAIHLGRPLFVVVGLIGPVLLAVDHLAGRRGR